MSNSGLSGLSVLTGVIGSAAPPDPDVIAFAVNTGVASDNLIVSALDAMVRNLKQRGTWSKYFAIYPMVGGSATSHSRNLRNPADADAAFRIVWSGAVTHDANGVTGGGGIGDTKIVGGVEAMGFYTKDDNPVTDYAMGALSLGSSTDRSSIHARWSDGTTHLDPVNVGSKRMSFASSGPTGHLSYTYRQFLSCYAQRNGANVGFIAPLPSDPPLPPIPSIHLLGANGNPGNRSYRTYSLFTIGQYLTPAELLADSLAFTAFQAALGRAI